MRNQFFLNYIDRYPVVRDLVTKECDNFELDKNQNDWMKLVAKIELLFLILKLLCAESERQPLF